jgi:hypothetical protein
MTLTSKPQAAKRPPRGQKKPEAQGLSAWHCTIDPKRHVEVPNLGLRPVKDCTVKSCTGVMVHWGRVRALAPDHLRSRNGQQAWRVVYRSGYVCVENAEHFDPDSKS